MVRGQRGQCRDALAIQPILLLIEQAVQCLGTVRAAFCDQESRERKEPVKAGFSIGIVAWIEYLLNLVVAHNEHQLPPGRDDGSAQRLGLVNVEAAIAEHNTHIRPRLCERFEHAETVFQAHAGDLLLIYGVNRQQEPDRVYVRLLQRAVTKAEVRVRYRVKRPRHHRYVAV